MSEYFTREFSQLKQRDLGQQSSSFIDYLDKLEESMNSGVPNILVIVGLPGSGKTYFRRLIESYFSNCNSQTLIWGIHGEDAAREQGLITTSKREPYTSKELTASSNALEQNIVNYMDIDLIIAEFPGITSININSEILGRELGYTVLKNISKRSGAFSDLKYNDWYLTVIPDDYVRNVLTGYREEMQLIGDNLELARELAKKYNKPIPETVDDIVKAKQGAPLKLIKKAEEQVMEVIDLLKKRGELNIENFETLSLEEILNTYSEYLLTKHLAIPREKVFIGINSPRE